MDHFHRKSMRNQWSWPFELFHWFFNFTFPTLLRPLSLSPYFGTETCHWSETLSLELWNPFWGWWIFAEKGGQSPAGERWEVRRGMRRGGRGGQDGRPGRKRRCRGEESGETLSNWAFLSALSAVLLSQGLSRLSRSSIVIYHLKILSRPHFLITSVKTVKSS